jgi:hypothetical protein
VRILAGGGEGNDSPDREAKDFFGDSLSSSGDSGYLLKRELPRLKLSKKPFKNKWT